MSASATQKKKWLQRFCKPLMLPPCPQGHEEVVRPFQHWCLKKEVGNHGQEGKEEGCKEGEARDQAQVSLSV
jgi:hypothetical protein